MGLHFIRNGRIVELLMALALAIMVVLTFGNVVLRYVFNTGIDWAEELSRLMFVWLIFLGSILALRQRAHLGMEILQAALPPRLRRVSALISHVLILYGLWLFLVGSWDQTLIGLRTFSTVMHYPNALMASAGLVCSASMLVIVGMNLWWILRNDPRAHIPGTKPQNIAEIEGASE